MSNVKTKPLGVYVVREFTSQGEKRSSWTRVGVAFAHKKGPGFQVHLEALPVDGKLTIYPIADKKPGEQTAE